jgi:hypothetical protein
MSKTHGLGAGLLVGGYDISGDIGSVQRIASPRSVLPSTDITQSAEARLLALKDGGIDFTAYFNPDTDQAHEVLSALPRTDQVSMYLHRSGVHGSMVAAMVAKQINYDPNRTQDGALSLGVSLVSNGFGLEWGDLLSEGLQTFVAADESASVDYAASSAFGLQAYLQVLELTGTDVTFAIQGSSDNGAGDAFADITGAVFTEVTAAPAAERIQTARNAAIERYLRVAATGTFTSVTYAVAVVRNPYEVNF